ncbi:LexA family transcriptional regulator [Streptococcus thoraltensis]|uniref:XRE family transcriptional regulator n=1 Tax=Streptococcus thoraltensis TaxID=55085 RepID=UPI00037F76A6|nr:LexA family transcriptional regulator [Streptococcus thoraltensis]MDY4760592.1 LexA family transcriptional regulator [Streptococcus thoraltensis]
MNTNNEIIDIISQRKAELNLSLSQLSRQVGMAKSAVSCYLNKTREFPLNRIPQFAQALDLSPEVLLGISEDDYQIIFQKLNRSRQEQVLDFLNHQLAQQEAEKQDLDQPIYSVKTVTQLAAGLGYAFNDYDFETVHVPSQPPRYDIASIVNGDSMYPTYRNGDVVYLVDRGFTSYNGEVCAIAVNDRTFLKQVYLEKEQLRLVSINPDYDDILLPFPPEEDTHIKIYQVVGRDTTIAI